MEKLIFVIKYVTIRKTDIRRETMRKPIIGLTPSLDEQQKKQQVQPGYLESIHRAGGLGLMLPLTDRDEDIAQYAELCDGFLFVGGPDVEPSYYGQERLEVCAESCAARDTMDIKLMRAALKTGKPILGVCRGLQVLNVVLGGTLYQDVPSQYEGVLAHQMEEPYDRIVHPVRVEPDSPLGALSPLEGINSRHHQAIAALAPGLKAMAYAPDGLIEAVYMPDRKFVWAVQWHPEAFWDEEGANREVFERFVEAAR